MTVHDGMAYVQRTVGSLIGGRTDGETVVRTSTVVVANGALLFDHPDSIGLV